MKPINEWQGKLPRLVQLAACTAIVLVLQVALSGLPNIEVVTLLFIVYSKWYGRDTLWIVYAFALLEGMIYGFGLWWVSYLYVWTILVFLAMGTRKLSTRLGCENSAIPYAMLGAVFGLSFGALCAIPYLLTGGVGAAFAWWIAGIPFDLIHGGANAILIACLYRPLQRLA